jgi:hypothetical protein
MTDLIKKSRWFAVRAVPGTQRMAKLINGMPEARQGESVIERNLRNEGIDVYMPSVRVMVRHQRTRRVIEDASSSYRCGIMQNRPFIT